MFGITDEILQDPSRVKIIDGIAGAGKSSKIDRYFKDRDQKYLRFTSTNRLKRDAENRYGDRCYTIAGGLFTSSNKRFYLDEKIPVDCDIVVIDEVLQSSPRVFEWVKNNVGDFNVFLTTDSRQMLAPECERQIIGVFNEVIQDSQTVYRQLTETKRARTEETRAVYTDLYEHALDGRDHYKSSLPYRVISYNDMPFSPNDIYITHTKAIEDFLYRDRRIDLMDDIELIPKASIASKAGRDFSQYPCVSQLQAEKQRLTSYTQAGNVATPTRYQGSEVTDKQTLYYLIEETSRITSRELYTVITRLWDIRNIVIVLCQLPIVDDFTTFMGLPVKEHSYLNLTDKVDPTDIVNGCIPKSKAKEFVEKAVSDTYAYDENLFLYDGALIRADGIPELPKLKNGIQSYIKKEQYFSYSITRDVYRILEKYELDHISGVHYNNSTCKDDFRYYVDLFSAYPTVLKYEKLPIDGHIYYTYDPDKMNFYLYTGTELTQNSLITDDLASLYMDDCIYLFSTDYTVGSKMGEKLFDLAHRDQRGKDKVKSIRWGWLQKRFIEKYDQYYVRYSGQIHELLMVAILSQLLYRMIKCKNNMGISDFYICVDALHFNDLDIEAIQDSLAGYDYRIKDTSEIDWVFMNKKAKKIYESGEMSFEEALWVASPSNINYVESRRNYKIIYQTYKTLTKSHR